MQRVFGETSEIGLIGGGDGRTLVLNMENRRVIVAVYNRGVHAGAHRRASNDDKP
jgi:hypothetical protein